MRSGFLRLINMSILLMLLSVALVTAAETEKTTPAPAPEVVDQTPETTPMPPRELTAQQRAAALRVLQGAGLSRALVSVQVRRVSDGRTLFEYNPTELCIPASTNKLVTAAAAFALLGPNYRFQTIVRADRTPDKTGVIYGNLYLIGRGDPYLTVEQLWKIVRELKRQGIRQITGDLVGDDSFQDAVRFYPEWGRRTAQAYHAPLGALSVNFNTIAVFVRPGGEIGQPAVVTFEPQPAGLQVKGSINTVGGSGNECYLSYKEGAATVNGSIGIAARPDPTSHAVDDPLAFSLAAFRELLAHEGIIVKGQSRAGVAPAKTRLLGEFESEELSLIVRRLFRFSNNFTAEEIFQTIGALKSGKQASRLAGSAAVTAWLQAEKLHQPGAIAFDGSGLARENRQSAAGLVNILMWMANRPELFPDYLSAMAIGGVDGTLRFRYKQSPLRGRVRAKTGLLNGVVTLAGFIYDANDEMYAFAVLVNNPQNGVRATQREVDRLLEILMQ